MTEVDRHVTPNWTPDSPQFGIDPLTDRQFPRSTAKQACSLACMLLNGDAEIPGTCYEWYQFLDQLIEIMIAAPDKLQYPVGLDLPPDSIRVQSRTAAFLNAQLDKFRIYWCGRAGEFVSRAVPIRPG